MKKLISAGGLLVLVACTSPGPVGTEGTWVGTITTEGNVTTVINESGSVWGGTATLVEEASIGVDVGDAPYMLASISSITASEDRIFLLEQSPLIVRVYDMAGVHLLDIGSEGQGPGELNQTYSIGIRPDGKLLVRADGNGRMNVFSADGEFLEDWPLPAGYVNASPMVVMADGTVFTRLPTGETDQDGFPRRGMVPFGIDGSQVGEPIFLPDNESILTLGRISGTSSTGRRVTRTMSVPFSPGTPSALSHLGAMIVGVADQYRFEVRSFDGATLIVERLTDPVPVHPDEAAWHRRSILAQARDLDASFSWNGPDVPPGKPFFSGFYADQSGRIWVRRPGPGRHLSDCDEDPAPGNPGSIARCWEDTANIEVFGAEGRYLGTVDLPEGAQLRSARAFVRGDLVLLRVEDEAGTIMVKRYRLVLPGEERQ